MYKLSISISYRTIHDNNINVYLETLKRCKANRVFICSIDLVFRQDGPLYTQQEKLEKVIRFFQSNGVETGVWPSALGNGGVLTHDEGVASQKDFTYIEGVFGGGNKFGYCPMDRNFIEAYQNAVRTLAQMQPDVIMLDDDFRLNNRSYYGVLLQATFTGIL